ncbi:MAG TPA: response regulator [Pyrinomonadaceae bacterium]|nr:response regulator [Pyrinomonadaceae bacterium]
MSIKQTILIVDDDEVIRDVLTMALEESYDVLEARDGLEAVYAYSQHGERVVAIVTDVEMPRLNGLVLTEWVHHINPQLPVIIMTGGLRTVELKELLKHPTVSFLGKPFELPQLETLLNHALGKRMYEAA